MRPNSAPPDVPEDLTDDPEAYSAPEELADTLMDEGGLPRQPRAPRSAALRLAVAAAVVLAVGGALLAYRAHHRGKVLAEGLARADALLRLDTAAGYREAASLLEPLAELDAVDAASVRAFALAMLFADYRAADLEAEADALLVGPGRAGDVPAHAHLAVAALALGRREAGTATSATARAGDGPWSRTLQARVAFLAGNVAAALDPAAAAAEGSFAPGLAVHGDALRRLRHDSRAARAAYEAALAASPMQPRAAYGLAKLALGGNAPTAEATAALERLLADAAGTPAPERARAALHLAALRLREGDRVGAGAALDGAALDPPARAWAARAAAVAAEHRGAYRAVQGAPASLQSASDDDPPVLSPAPPPRPVAKATAKKATAKKRTATTRTTATKRKTTSTRRTRRR
jgi:hypothetical protein